MRLTSENAAALAAEFIATIPEYPGGFSGQGIVTCGGGIKYGTCAYVLIRLLRDLGCELPIEVWYLGEDEGDLNWIELVRSLDVECKNAFDVCDQRHRQQLGGWELKPFAIQHSRFREVLFIDADNVPVRDPSFLFHSTQYQRTGTVFWPDPETFRTKRDSRLWDIFGLRYRPSPDQESGQLLVDKERCWQALNLCNWYNAHSDFFYQHVYGDKETFRFAWQRVEQPISWIPTFASERLKFTLCQHDFAGDTLFQHRFYHKWSLYQENPRIKGFVHEEKCLSLVEELRESWDPLEHLLRRVTNIEQATMESLSQRPIQYERVGQSRWPMTLANDGHIQRGFNPHARFWRIEQGELVLTGNDGKERCRLQRTAEDVWQGSELGKRQQRIRVRTGLLN